MTVTFGWISSQYVSLFFQLFNFFYSKYPVARKTVNLRVPYFVKENFHTEYQGSLRRLEMSVEEEYITSLRHACYREKSYRKYFEYYC